MSSPLLQIEVQLFAAAAAAAGVRQMELALPSGATMEDLQQQVIERCADLAVLAAASRWAVGTEFVPADYVFTAPQKVAMIPPVSGG